jgi:hypothetical protein
MRGIVTLMGGQKPLKAKKSVLQFSRLFGIFNRCDRPEVVSNKVPQKVKEKAFA